MNCDYKALFHSSGPPPTPTNDKYLFIVGGEDNDIDVLRGAELIDLSGEGRTCTFPRDLPSPRYGLSSLKTRDGNPLACGGREDNSLTAGEASQRCYEYNPNNDNWDSGLFGPSLRHPRYFSPTAEIANGDYWVAGIGYPFQVNEFDEFQDFSSEVFQDGSFVSGPDLPSPDFSFFESPCAARISDDRTFYSDGRTALIYNWNTGTFTEMASPEYGVNNAQCGFARKANGQEIIVMVHNDYNAIILDLVLNEWRTGVNLAPPFAFLGTMTV